MLEFLPGAKSTSNFIPFHPLQKPYYCALYVSEEMKVAGSVMPTATQTGSGRESSASPGLQQSPCPAGLEGSKFDYVAPWAETDPEIVQLVRKSRRVFGLDFPS